MVHQPVAVSIDALIPMRACAFIRLRRLITFGSHYLHDSTPRPTR